MRVYSHINAFHELNFEDVLEYHCICMVAKIFEVGQKSVKTVEFYCPRKWPTIWYICICMCVYVRAETNI